MMCKLCKDGVSCGNSCIICHECLCICSIDIKVNGIPKTMIGHFILGDKMYCVKCYKNKFGDVFDHTRY